MKKLNSSLFYQKSKQHFLYQILAQSGERCTFVSAKLLMLFNQTFIDGLHRKKIQGRVRSWIAGKTVSCHVQGIYQFFKDNQDFVVANFLQKMRVYFLNALIFKSSLISQ